MWGKALCKALTGVHALLHQNNRRSVLQLVHKCQQHSITSSSTGCGWGSG